jgi:hypothetical protein
VNLLRLAITATVMSAGCSIVGYPVDRADPRFHGCAGDSARVTAAFPMAAARDYVVHIPLMARSPELDDSAAPAFVVVFDTAWPGGVAIAPPAEKHLMDRATPGPGLHDLCIWVGTPGTGSFTVYGAVNTTGLRP